MPEKYQWQSALATLGLEARALAPVAEPGVTLSERRVGTQLVIRGDAAEAEFAAGVSSVLGLDLPTEPKTAHRKGDRTLLWLGPDEWLAVVAGEGEDRLAVSLAEALVDLHHAIADVSHSRAVIGLEGPRAREVLMKGTNVDLHPRVFAEGSCVQAHLGRCHMLLHQLDAAPRYDIYVHRSFAVYAWSWLSDASREYGLSIASSGAVR
ncbi:MAG: sarcosine oxidase subunit gamma [Gammaproteobacteria bacterium]|nr:sarcosine oxidase subunit gamma [Gammaproteobacteria bacterium]NIM73646.1 sarcosine oxidase subunit gamma [Gammaproteobacteria bacterium]NIN40300.1 sarcosine oxidase subunit gamma [Gammaproteobacteria bacterium]NIO25463.1 sarcosine oxidase subunit gamma [Gammaproteobacteria bacterium]NIO66140.1 sarcosine oxidase subunit gamma [Gammaproteobacteria bacterium]